MDTIRHQLTIFSRKYNLYINSSAALLNNLITLTHKVFPGVNELFSSPGQTDGHQKLVDFITTF